MSLTVYDPDKDCFVLAPAKPEVINAFHPDFMKTHMPDFMKPFRTADANKRMSMTMSNRVEELRKTDPTVGYLHVSKVPREIKAPKMMRPKKVDLMPKDFHIYQKAGMPKETK